MSFSQDDKPTNPAKQFIKIKSGATVYYDKESKQNITVPTPMDFIVLDQLATVTGWSDGDTSGFWSNEVKSVGSDKLTVKTKNGTKATGLWKEIKTQPAVSGAKYTSSIYIAHFVEGKAHISNLALTGAALNSWIEFTQANNIKANKVKLSGWADAKKGSVSYKTPIFETTEMTDGERDQAIELDTQLQEHLSNYFNYTPKEVEEQPSFADDIVVTEVDEDFDIAAALEDMPI